MHDRRLLWLIWKSAPANGRMSVALPIGVFLTHALLGNQVLQQDPRKCMPAAVWQPVCVQEAVHLCVSRQSVPGGVCRWKFRQSDLGGC